LFIDNKFLRIKGDAEGKLECSSSHSPVSNCLFNDAKPALKTGG
jgi:hypothetical protein